MQIGVDDTGGTKCSKPHPGFSWQNQRPRSHSAGWPHLQTGAACSVELADARMPSLCDSDDGMAAIALHSCDAMHDVVTSVKPPVRVTPLGGRLLDAAGRAVAALAIAWLAVAARLTALAIARFINAPPEASNGDGHEGDTPSGAVTATVAMLDGPVGAALGGTATGADDDAAKTLWALPDGPCGGTEAAEAAARAKATGIDEVAPRRFCANTTGV